MNIRARYTAMATAMILAAAPAFADDTEIYIGQSTEEAAKRNPNILFIVDTSGSMAGVVEVEEDPYDANVDYDDVCVADTAGDNERIYWRQREWDHGEDEWATEPPCGSDRWLEPEAMLIDDVNESLASQAGMAIAEAARYHEETQTECTDWEWSWSEWEYVCQETETSTGWEAEPLQAGNHTDAVEFRDTNDDDENVYGFYTANYVNWFYSVGNEGETNEMTRLQVVKDIASDLVDSISGVNVGLMRFDKGSGYGDEGYSGGYVDLAVGEISGNRGNFKAILAGDSSYSVTEDEDTCHSGSDKHGYCPSGSTPLAETLYEAARYWRGEGVHFGDDTTPGQSVMESQDGEGVYTSPAQYACQKNHIVYLSDGEPQYDSEVDDVIQGLTGATCDHDDPYNPDDDDNCLDELAAFLYDTDQRTDVPGTNRVTTHTVGFFTDQQLLEATARKGHGEYYTADNYGDLKTALTTLFTNILSSTSLFTAPAVSVNAFNRLEHLNQVYFALFRPSERAVWHGNVKRYAIEDGQLVDVDDQSAIEESTGQFQKSAKSYWSDVVDGDDVPLGGAASEIPAPDARSTYTDIDGDATMEDLHEDNADVTAAMLDADESDRDKLLRWIRGVDVDDTDGDGSTSDARNWMGDPLHARPALVTYGTSEADPLLTMFVMTNEGYLHAIDTDDGSELWAYMPQSLLPNIEEQYSSSRPGERTYGLDGPLTAAGYDGDVHLYFGMRRGGRDYHALDVTDRNAPETLWTVEGGQPGFEELGQTWSQTIPTEVDINGTERDVLIFAGGNDPSADGHTTRADHGAGRAIFIIDASDGTILWSGADDAAAGDHEATFASMDYSIPSDLRIIDINNDGLADQMYVGDMGGQIWRFDIHNGNPAASLVTGGVIADLATDAEAGNRRFYYAPDIALITEGAEQWLSLSIGSGWRAHPLNETVADRFYMLEITDVFEAPRNDDDEIEYGNVTEADLYDATANLVAQGDEQAAERAKLEDAAGWFIQLNNSGEKVMAESVTLAGTVVFTTYQPSDDAAEICGPGAGIGRAYAVDVTDATAVNDQDGDGDKTADDRSVRLKRAGIPPAPTVVFLGNEPSVLVGPEMPLPPPPPIGDPTRIYWSAGQ